MALLGAVISHPHHHLPGIECRHHAHSWDTQQMNMQNAIPNTVICCSIVAPPCAARMRRRYSVLSPRDTVTRRIDYSRRCDRKSYHRRDVLSSRRPRVGDGKTIREPVTIPKNFLDTPLPMPILI
jgi:hypothetical protein